jgi:hypothetical protein
MSQPAPVIEKLVRLSPSHAERLRLLAQRRQLSEDEIVAKALDALFALAELLDEGAEHRGWSLLSQDALARVRDNEADAVYDNWRDLYGVPAG